MSEIASKNLMYLSEILTQEKVAHAKMKNYEGQAKDPALKKLIAERAKAHAVRYQDVYKYLLSHK